jgi:hypothetical protein
MTKQVKTVQSTSRDAKKSVDTKPAELRCPVSKEEAEALAWAVHDELEDPDLTMTVVFLQERNLPLAASIKWLLAAGCDCDCNVLKFVQFPQFEGCGCCDRPDNPLSGAEISDLYDYLYGKLNQPGLRVTKACLQELKLPKQKTIEWLTGIGFTSDLDVGLYLQYRLDDQEENEEAGKEDIEQEEEADAEE